MTTSTDRATPSSDCAIIGARCCLAPRTRGAVVAPAARHTRINGASLSMRLWRRAGCHAAYLQDSRLQSTNSADRCWSGESVKKELTSSRAKRRTSYRPDAIWQPTHRVSVAVGLGVDQPSESESVCMCAKPCDRAAKQTNDARAPSMSIDLSIDPHSLARSPRYPSS